jgi:hypothetical protein
MSVAQACAEAEDAIQRARSLFAAAPEPAAPADGDGAINVAAQSTTAAAKLTGGLSGAMVAEHKSFVDQSASTFGVGARSDGALNADVTTAATLTQTGAAHLAAIAAETQATARAAGAVPTPAGERVILTALRSQVARAGRVLNATQQQAAGLAGQIRALDYPHDSPTGNGIQALDNDTPVTPAPAQSSPDDVIVNNATHGKPTIQLVDNPTGGSDPTPGLPYRPPPPGAQPQIGPFPVPPQVAAATPSLIGPADPTGGMLMPSPVPTAPQGPPESVPGVPIPGVHQAAPVVPPPPVPSPWSHPGCTTQQWRDAWLTYMGTAAGMGVSIPFGPEAFIPAWVAGIPVELAQLDTIIACTEPPVKP